jgi:predicted transcriptional regulator
MKTAKRATVYFDPELHRALRRRAVANDRSISDIVNEAVRLTLAEDAEDLDAFDTRVRERSVPFETALKDLKRRGRI